MFIGALVHEIGHVAFAEYLSDDEKAEWFALHIEGPPGLDTHDVFDGDEEEDFAECFRLHIMSKKLLHRHSAQKLSFMEAISAKLIKARPSP